MEGTQDSTTIYAAFSICNGFQVKLFWVKVVHLGLRRLAHTLPDYCLIQIDSDLPEHHGTLTNPRQFLLAPVPPVAFTHPGRKPGPPKGGPEVPPKGTLAEGVSNLNYSF